VDGGTGAGECNLRLCCVAFGLFFATSMTLVAFEPRATCLISLPLGIYGLIVLRRKDVREIFQNKTK
jgi:hypothetical protein